MRSQTAIREAESAFGIHELFFSRTDPKGHIRHLAAILRHVGGLSSSLETMRALEVNGRIEAARASDAKDVRSLFVTIGEQIRSARAQIGDLATVRRIAHSRDDGAERQVLTHVRTVSERVRALAVAA